MRRSTQGGFTIIEVMLVAMIMAILASMMLPSIRENSARAKVSEAILASSTCKAAVTEVYMTNGVAPSNGDWGCDSPLGQPVSQYVGRVHTTPEGIVLIDIFGANDLRLDSNTISLEPLDGDGNLMTDGVGPVRRWRCGKPGGDLTTLNPKYLPGTCLG